MSARIGVAITTRFNNVDALKASMKERVGRALKEAAARAAEKARERVPVDTGFLQGSIGAREEEPGRRWVVEATAPYAAFVELGTRNMAAQPYIIPSVEEVRAEMKDILIGEMTLS